MRAFVLRLFDTTARVTARLFGWGMSYRVKFFWGLYKDKVFTYSNTHFFRYVGGGAIISRSCVLVNPRYITIGEGSSIGAGSVITAWDHYESDAFSPEIIIGKFTSVGSECHITAINRVVIGDCVLLGKKVSIIDNSHGELVAGELDIPPVKRPLSSKGPVVIEDNVWIGDKATVLPGVRIGRGSVIAANSVVCKDIPPACVAAGVPARVIRGIDSAPPNAPVPLPDKVVTHG
jgi:acetyltransferase-like isoleucine patch superfamily enzyme